MKAQFFLLSLILFVITSCSKNDDVTPATTQNISIGGKEYVVKGSGFVDYGYDSKNVEYNIDFVLTSEEMTANKKLIGLDYVIYIESYSVSNQFMPGTFTMDESTKQYGTVSFMEKGAFSTLQSGNFTITKGSGSQYTISIDGTLAGGSKIKGTYTGNFPELSENIFMAQSNGSARFKIR